jgi:long-chain acyl-CoA synthetase
MAGLDGAILISDYSLLLSRNEKLTDARKRLNELFGARYPERFLPGDIHYYEDKPDELALINYTSGSTGFSKGVMLAFKNLWSNTQFTIDHLKFLNPGDPIVCMLPLAHMYGMLVELIHPLVKGCHIYFLTRVPSPKVIMDAFATVKPKLIVTVPLIIEKIIKTRVFPLLDKPLMKILLYVPFVDDQLLAKVKAKITETFGGNLNELIIGGAALNKDVEAFLRRIKFPYTVGYGMTECAPLITYENWKKYLYRSCGKGIVGMELRIDSEDPTKKEGELQVRGVNVMAGYYKNDQATREAFTEDGWMRTGDLGIIDKDGNLFLRGRSKNMLLGPSGQNIYPEEIEDKLNSMPLVLESVVVQRDQKLVALVYPDTTPAGQKMLANRNIFEFMEDIRKELNKQLPQYSQVTAIEVVEKEFEKTPKRSIKRFLYS